jgi:hypothetical protein
LIVSIGAKQRRVGDGIISCKHVWNNCSIRRWVWSRSSFLQWIILNNKSSIWWWFIIQRPFNAALIQAQQRILGNMVNVFNSTSEKKNEFFLKMKNSNHTTYCKW